MDTPDWERLKQLVEENGAGCVNFELDGDFFVVDSVELEESSGNIVVSLA